jgi:hypothetical protein
VINGRAFIYLFIIKVPAEFNGDWFTDGGGHRGPGRPKGAKRKMPAAFEMPFGE